MKNIQRIAILGGGPSGLFMFKRLVEAEDLNVSITVFERKKRLGAGMPYSDEGANDEHITNVSGNEIPLLVTTLAEWIKNVPKDTLDKYHIDPERFNEFKVLPRLLFGQYLTAQFDLLQKLAKDKGIDFNIHYNNLVTDVIDNPLQEIVLVEIDKAEHFEFDRVIICTGHNWPVKHEGKVPNYYDSPYPPQKLALKVNHSVAIKGSSLTAVDAIRTLARHNGTFKKNRGGKMFYKLAEHSQDFKLVLHTRNGMLPAVRFHLEDSHLSNNSLLTAEQLNAHITANNGFLSLDYLFEHDFKAVFRDKDPEFYARLNQMSMEEFVTDMMALREQLDPFQLLKAEYTEAAKSIRRKQSVYWKEMLGVLSFAMNYPAKHLSAEDMQRLQKTLLPLISIVIAYIPQSSCEEMLALHEAGALDLIPVGDDSYVEANPEGGATYHYTSPSGDVEAANFKTFIDCVGQPHLSFEDLPFNSLIQKRTATPARLLFKSANEGEKARKEGQDVIVDGDGKYYLKVPGITINDSFQLVDNYGALNNRIYMMAVPYIGGFNPDYSGLDFSEAASEKILKSISENYIYTS